MLSPFSRSLSLWKGGYTLIISCRTSGHREHCDHTLPQIYSHYSQGQIIHTCDILSASHQRYAGQRSQRKKRLLPLLMLWLMKLYSEIYMLDYDLHYDSISCWGPWEVTGFMFTWMAPCCGLNENALHRLVCWNTCIQVVELFGKD